MTVITAPDLATWDSAGDDDISRASVLTLVPAPARPDVCIRLAEQFLDWGYGLGEIGPFLEDFGTSPAWKQQVRNAIAVLQSAAAS
jgi:hypothetical protein